MGTWGRAVVVAVLVVASTGDWASAALSGSGQTVRPGSYDVTSPKGERPCPGGPPCANRKPAPAPCTEDERPGGSWPGLNGDLRNTRNQPAEDVIGVAEAPRLEPAWTFSGEQVGAVGGMRSTPVVSGGCVFLGLGQGYLGSSGHVVALDADTGVVVWSADLGGSVLGLSVANGLVYAARSKGTRGEPAMPVVTDSYLPAGSDVVALDVSSGATAWTSARLDDGTPGNGTFINATPVAYEAGGRSLLFVPLAGGSGDGARVPMYFLDALTGATVRRALTMTDAEYAEGFGGTGIWSTAAYDVATGHLYAGTADSDSHTRQHPYNNALLRIDADPSRSTFTTVVDSYKGTSEHADLDDHIGSQNNPACGALGGATGTDLPTFFDTSSSVECLELDLDFGASPNLWTDSSGDLVITALQKSGVFHTVAASSMEAKKTFFVGPGGPAMHSSTAAVGPDTVHVGATPDLVFSLGKEDDSVRVSSTGNDLFAYQPLTLAGGVLYAINDMGQLLGLDADAAVVAPVLARDIATDGGFEQCLGVGAGVAVAMHTVFVPCDAGGPADLAGLPASPGGLVAYRLT